MSTPNNERTTWRQRWMKITGYVFIPERQVGVVHRNGIFHRFLPTGYHRQPNPWNEALVGHISIFVGNVPLTLQVHSQDGFEFSVALNARYSFDPIQAAPNQKSIAAAVGLRPKPGAILREWVQRVVNTALTSHMGVYNAAQLLDGQTRSRVARQVCHDLNEKLNASGLSFRQSDGVIITAITPPPDLARSLLQTYNRKRLIDLWKEMPAELRTLDLFNQLFQNSGASLNLIDSQIGALWQERVSPGKRTHQTTDPHKFSQNGSNNGHALPEEVNQ